MIDWESATVASIADQANSDAGRERQNARQRERRRSYLPVDDATRIVLRPKGLREIPLLATAHRDGSPFKRNQIYGILLDSPTAADHKAKCRAAGLITGKEDFRRAEKKKWIELHEPEKTGVAPTERGSLNDLRTAIRNNLESNSDSQAQFRSEVERIVPDIGLDHREGLEFAANLEADDLGIASGVERRQAVDHIRWERNPEAARVIKQRARFVCEICSEQMGDKYGRDIGANYAEAHHKIPLSTQPVTGIVISADDLVCVCANCHRMLHKLIGSGAEDAVQELKARVQRAIDSGDWHRGPIADQ